ncbi:MAG TPA: hypothetical protein DCS93_34880 [Microscillaceae bacterium]|nr:hypothetical protein [Microscillaceae bacterium]
MKTFHYAQLLCIMFLLLVGQVIAQPMVTKLELKKGSVDYAGDAVEVPLNAFQIVLTFDQPVRSANNTPINTLNEAVNMLILKATTPAGTPDILELAYVQSVLVGSVGNQDSIITVDVVFAQDLIPNQSYTLSLNRTQVLSAADGQMVQSFTTQFTTASAVTTVAGVANIAALCHDETSELSAIVLAEGSRYSFVPQTTETLQLTLSNSSDFEFVGGVVQVSVLGGSGVTATVIQQTSTRLSIQYSIGSDPNKSHALSISGVRVKFRGTTDATTQIIVDNTPGRYNINGLSPGNTSVVLGTIEGKASIPDNSLNVGALSGSNSLCLGTSTLYTVPPVAGATHYQWSVPTGFTPQGGINLTGNQWQTTQNFITLLANNTGTQNLVVKATNNCREGLPSTPLPITIHAPTPATSIQFTAPGLGTFNGSGAIQSIANVLGGQVITVNTPTNGTVTFSGPGMVGNTFYPSIAPLGVNVIQYTFANAQGCTTTGSFGLDVFDASITISDLLSAYCDNETSNQEFKVKTTINGLPVNTSNIVLEKLVPSPIRVVASPAPFTTGFGFKTVTATDHILVIRPDVLGPGQYRITVSVGLSNIVQDFVINPTPNPVISGKTRVCANTSSTYEVTQNSAHTYAWSLSGGGTPTVGNGSALTINWLSSTTTQSYTLTLTETNINTQCARTVSQTITVDAQPSPEIEGPSSVCANSTQQYRIKGGATVAHNYEWSVAGGVITLLGAEQITVVWGSVTTGVIQLTETNSQSCQTLVTQTVTVAPLSVPMFTTGAEELCATSKGQHYSVAAANKADLMIWEVQGGTIVGGSQSGDVSKLSANGLEQVVIDWGDGSQGNITVTEVNANGCEGIISKVVKLNPLPRLAFSGFAPQYCNNSSTVTLFPTVDGAPPPIQANARFVVRDFTNTRELFVLPTEVFFPQQLFQLHGRGNYHLVFEYTDDKSCFNRSIAFPFKLENAPQDVRLNISQIEGNPKVVFRATAANVDKNWQWQWTWQWGAGFRSASTQQNDTLDVLSTQRQTIAYTLKLENSVQCDETIIRTALIDFEVDGNVWQRSTDFTDLTNLGNEVIDSWHWDFGDGQESTLQNPSHTYQSIGTYQVVLTIKQGVISYTLQKQINIFPLVVVTPTTPYKVTFETGKADWVNNGTIQQAGQIIPKNSWKLSDLKGNQHITNTTDNHVWITDNRADSTIQGSSSQFYDNEQSYVESPFFDITTLDRPFVRFRYWSDMNDGADGVVLLYTIDDGETWQRLGTQSEGINWYTHIRILGNPGESSGSLTNLANKNWEGWSGHTQTTHGFGWQVAHLSLETIKQEMTRQNKTQVRFRLAFGSNADSPANGRFEGFAFDDFEVLNQNRKVLWEYFGNQSMAQVGKAAHDSAAVNPQAISIHYHLDFPAKDVINEQNPHDHSGRAFYYGVRATPRLAVDGHMPDTTAWEFWASNNYAERILRSAPFDITIARPTAISSKLSVSTTITALEDFDRQVIFQVVVIDTSVTINDTVYYDVMRKMLPDAAGTFRANAWAKGESQTLQFEWDYGDLDPSGFKVVVFIQDYGTKEVYQAQVTNQPVNQRLQEGGEVTSIENPSGSAAVLIFPNPVIRFLKAQLPFRGASGKVLRWQIVALNGQTLQSGRYRYVQNKPLRIDLGKLAGGVYLFKVFVGDQVYSSRFEKR